MVIGWLVGLTTGLGELSGNPGKFNTSRQRVSSPYKLAGLQSLDPFSKVPQRLHLALLVAAPGVTDVFSWVTGAGQRPAIREAETCVKSGLDNLLVSHWPASSSAMARRLSLISTIFCNGKA